MDFATTLKTIRKEKGYTQSSLAKELNVSLFMKSKCSKFLRKPRGIYEKSPRLTIPLLK